MTELEIADKIVNTKLRIKPIGINRTDFWKTIFGARELYREGKFDEGDAFIANAHLRKFPVGYNPDSFAKLSRILRECYSS